MTVAPAPRSAAAAARGHSRCARRPHPHRARRLHHQGKPHVRPGVRRYPKRQRRPLADHVRRDRHAQSAPPRRAVRAARQLLRQRRQLAATAINGSRRRTKPRTACGRAIRAAAIRSTAPTRSPIPPEASSGMPRWRARKPCGSSANMPAALRTPPKDRLELLEAWKRGDDFTSRWQIKAPIEPLNKILAPELSRRTAWAFPDVVSAPRSSSPT